VPYGYLLSHQAATLNEHFILLSTRRPDLFRIHEILGAVMLIALAAGVWRARIEPTEPRFIYAASLALLPFLVFNQQILTGKTMQAFHFEIGVVNYTSLVGLIITLSLLWKPVPRRVLIWVAGLSLALGVVLVALPARLVFVPQTIAYEKMNSRVEATERIVNSGRNTRGLTLKGRGFDAGVFTWRGPDCITANVDIAGERCLT
jgi:hypothetical protein